MPSYQGRFTGILFSAGTAQIDIEKQTQWN
jgi:hypothetical protein